MTLLPNIHILVLISGSLVHRSDYISEILTSNNKRLITTNTQDPDPILTIKPLDQATKMKKKGFLYKKPVLVFASLIFLISPLVYAHAGIFSFLGDIFEKTTTVFQKEEYNSQNIVLLQAAINTDPNPSKGGGGITIVEASALLPEQGLRGTGGIEVLGPKSDQISVYVVRPGDSVSQIAKMFGVSAKTIIWANDLNNEGIIQPDQTLVILPVSGVRHIVQKGETVASIAKKYDADTEEVMDFNGFEKNHILAVDDTVIVPGGEMQIEAPTSVARAYVVAPAGSTQQVGYYIRPVNGGVKTQGIHGYNAVDIAASHGTPILASANGEVILSKYAEGNPWFGGYGNYVVIQHSNGAQTVYAHLSNNLVKRGWKVVQGQIIGYMGSTGRSTGTHLHFEIRNDIRNPF
ncbi:MAG: M23 family metallopeptidase [Candidatus Pacebacteria bacterium]|nr:M23 family metallopeptidase [Candidatus Paceibacterota bacterium]